MAAETVMVVEAVLVEVQEAAMAAETVMVVEAVLVEVQEAAMAAETVMVAEAVPVEVQEAAMAAAAVRVAEVLLVEVQGVAAVVVVPVVEVQEGAAREWESRLATAKGSRMAVATALEWQRAMATP
jgi:hypothetical protein